MKRKLLISAAIALAANASHANAETLDDKINKLEQEIQVLKRQNEVNDEKQKAVAEKAASVDYTPGNGLTITSPDKSASVKVSAYGQLDSRTFTGNQYNNVSSTAPNNIDQFLLRTARLSLDGTFENNFATKFTYEFGNNSPALLDAYLDYKPSTLLNFRAGKFKSPIGLERLQSESELETLERGFVTNFVPNRDVGIEVYGDLIPQTLTYQLALTNGAADGVNSSVETDSPKDVVARLFATPFRNSSIVPLQGLGLGVAGSYGSRDGALSPTGNTNLGSYKSPAQATIFSYGANTFADGTDYRINPELYYYYGPFGVLSEYIVEGQEVTNGANHRNLKNSAWSVAPSYVLTGENASYDGVKPLENFNFENGGLGAWEVIGRFGKLNIDKDTFPIYATATAANQIVNAATERTIGLNWYLNQSLKINTAYSDTDFSGGFGPSGRETEKVYLTRFQFKI